MPWRRLRLAVVTSEEYPSLGEHSHAPGEYVAIEPLRSQIKRTAILVYRLRNRPSAHD
jgi:hypothetical protein